MDRTNAILRKINTCSRRRDVHNGEEAVARWKFLEAGCKGIGIIDQDVNRSVRIAGPLDCRVARKGNVEFGRGLRIRKNTDSGRSVVLLAVGGGLWRLAIAKERWNDLPAQNIGRDLQQHVLDTVAAGVLGARFVN